MIARRVPDKRVERDVVRSLGNVRDATKNRWMREGSSSTGLGGYPGSYPQFQAGGGSYPQSYPPTGDNYTAVVSNTRSIRALLSSGATRVVSTRWVLGSAASPSRGEGGVLRPVPGRILSSPSIAAARAA